MSFSLCIAFTYCTDDLVQGNEEGKFIDRDVSVRNILRISRQRLKMSVRKSLMCINHPVDYYSKHKKTISTQRKLLDVHQYDHVVRPSMLRKNPFCLKHFSEQGTTDHVTEYQEEWTLSSLYEHGHWVHVSMQLLLQELVVVASLLRRMPIIKMIKIRIRYDSFKFLARSMWRSVHRMIVL